MRGGSQQGFQGSRGGHARKLAAQKEGEQGADRFWRAVLKDLNLWNKRAVARKVCSARLGECCIHSRAATFERLAPSIA